MSSFVDTSLPIGVFDSGVGGLTVLRALQRRMPYESFIYLGDTARLPYGTKGSDTVVRYALQAVDKLVERKIKLLVTACNTATAAALPALAAAHPGIPVVGVVEPGAEAACQVTRNGSILVLATESTIRNGAYSRAIQAKRPDARVTGIPCSLFVALAEEGWVDGPIVEAVTARYLAPLQNDPAAMPDTVVLGCTHFPPLAGAIQNVLGAGAQLVDSAATTAKAVEEALDRHNLRRPEHAPGTISFLTTDAPERFAKVAGIFLGRDLRPEEVELVSL